MNGWMDGWTHNRKGPSLHNSQKLTPDEYHRARLRAATAAHAGDWLLALPHSACGLRLDDEAIRIAACLRLGAWTCQLRICPCGGLVTADDSHGLFCGLGPGKYARHAYLNDIISRSLTLAGVPNIKEPRAFQEPAENFQMG